ncbi:MAG: hypothetical protein Q7O66_16395, partial [Dehalococcoidia bacterium]|nr:hypothetical protein [Dehalococcoidia bacterium]
MKHHSDGPFAGGESVPSKPKSESPEPSAEKDPSPNRRQSDADLNWREVRAGSHPGERYVRIVRPQSGKLRRVEPGHLVATERALEGRTSLARLSIRIRRALFGRPLTTADLLHERLSKVKALAVFASDAVSSSAYATEEILLVLVAASTLALHLSVWISLAIVALLAIVAISYSQTIRAYPQGGGSYIVTKNNLGTIPSLIAASSLLTDYVLTVAVSISAGVAALTSAIPQLLHESVLIAVLFVLLIMVVNLR